MRIARALVLRTIGLVSALFWLMPQCSAQGKIGPAEYDYYALAVASISTSAREASKLPDIPLRAKLLVKAVRLLPPSQHDESVRLLDVALRDLREWASVEKTTRNQRQTAIALRSDILALYAHVDPEKAATLLRELQAEAKSANPNSSITSLKGESWSMQFSDRGAIAGQSAKIALSLIDSDPKKAVALVVQSLQGGTVSTELVEIIQQLGQNGNRVLLDQLEMSIGRSLAGSASLDPVSLSSAGILVLTDPGMPSAPRTAFVSFFMRSLQAWATLIKEPGIDPSYISRTFFAFSQIVGQVISKYSPDQLSVFNLVLNEVGPLVPEKMQSVAQALQPETFSEPEDTLRDILRERTPDKRDIRLVRFVSGLLRSETGDLQKNLGLVAEAIGNFSDTNAKSAYTNLLTMIRMDALVKQEKFIEAQELVGSISPEEARAWALLAAAKVAAKSDRVLGFEMVSNGLKALDKASPSPHKVELALMAAAMLAKNDPQRALDTLSTASTYANSSAAKVDPPAKPPFAFGLEATIGEAHMRLGVVPASLVELKIDPSLSVLATTDWFRADEIVSNIREPALRLQLKLQFAGAVLAKELKAIRKEPAPKPSANN